MKPTILKVLAREDVQRDMFADPQLDYAQAVQFYQVDVVDAECPSIAVGFNHLWLSRQIFGFVFGRNIPKVGLKL